MWISLTLYCTKTWGKYAHYHVLCSFSTVSTEILVIIILFVCLTVVVVVAIAVILYIRYKRKYNKGTLIELLWDECEQVSNTLQTCSN